LIRIVDPADGEILHTPPAETLPARVAAMCDFANGGHDGPFIPPAIRAILVHFWLAYDHPFVDGNGRTARALFYWSMLRQGYWLTEFISISRVLNKARAQYARAFLYTETDNNDATYFILHQLRVVRRAIDDVFDYLRRKSKEVRDLESRLERREDLNTGRMPSSRMRSGTPTLSIRFRRTRPVIGSPTRRRAPTCSGSFDSVI